MPAGPSVNLVKQAISGAQCPPSKPPVSMSVFKLHARSSVNAGNSKEPMGTCETDPRCLRVEADGPSACARGRESPGSAPPEPVSNSVAWIVGAVARERGGREVSFDLGKRHLQSRRDVGIREAVHLAQGEHPAGVGGQATGEGNELAHLRIGGGVRPAVRCSRD